MARRLSASSTPRFAAELSHPRAGPRGCLYLSARASRAGRRCTGQGDRPARRGRQAGRLESELKKIRRYKLIIIDEVGYIRFDKDAANLFFQLIASRYEQRSVMVTSDRPLGKGTCSGGPVRGGAETQRVLPRRDVGVRSPLAVRQELL
ncbi:ATP-binding protein [Streptomyces sp. NPDC002550]